MSNSTPFPPPPPGVPTPNPQYGAPVASPRRRPTWAVPAIVAGSLAIGGALVWGLRGDDSKSTAPAASTATTVAATTLPATTVAATTPTTPTTVATSAPPAVVFDSHCTSMDYGWIVGVPRGWYVAGPETGAWNCAAFDRAPLVIGDDTEAFFPITVTYLAASFADTLAPYEQGPFDEILTMADVSVGGFRALRLETRATDAAMVMPGSLGITYIVDIGPQWTVVIDGTGATNVEYEEVKAIVDAMAGDIVFLGE